MHPLLANCLRLTVGTADDNMRMLQHPGLAMTSSALVPSASTDRTAEVSPQYRRDAHHRAPEPDGTGQASLHTGIGFDHMLSRSRATA